MHSLLLSAALLAPQVPSPAPESLLARIPEGLSVANELVSSTNRGCFVVRSGVDWSADGKTVAYAGMRGDDWYPVVGSKVGEAYVYVSRPTLAGGHVFFHVARNKSASTQASWLWIDGETLGPEDWMGDLGVSADGKQVAFWTQPGAKVGNAEPATSSNHFLAVAGEAKSGRWSVVRGKRWLGCALVPPCFSEDGQRVFTTALGEQGWILLRLAGKKETELSDPEPMIDSFSISGSGAVHAFVKTNRPSGSDPPCPSPGDAIELVFRGERTERKNTAITRCAVDPTGQHVACVVRVGSKAGVVIDAERELDLRFDHVLQLAFDPRGKQLAFVANLGGTPSGQTPCAVEGGEFFVVVREVSGRAAAKDAPHFRAVRDLVWDSSGDRLAYCAKDAAGWRVVCGEAQSPPYETVGAAHFNADSSSIGFGSRTGAELWWRALAPK
jgi:hypothetical protein